jgi:hypothetical protein
VNFSDPSGWVATGGVKPGDFVTFGEALVKPFLGDLGACGTFFVRCDGVDFGFGAFGERVGTMEVADEVLRGGAFEPGDEAAELAGVADGVAQAAGPPIAED